MRNTTAQKHYRYRYHYRYRPVTRPPCNRRPQPRRNQAPPSSWTNPTPEGEGEARGRVGTIFKNIFRGLHRIGIRWWLSWGVRVAHTVSTVVPTLVPESVLVPYCILVVARCGPRPDITVYHQVLYHHLRVMILGILRYPNLHLNLHDTPRTEKAMSGRGSRARKKRTKDSENWEELNEGPGEAGPEAEAEGEGEGEAEASHADAGGFS